MTIKVLIVDDSALIREVLSRSLASEPDIEIVGTAHDPFDAREKIRQLNPDVLTLDIEMPNMNGLEFLDRIMRLRPMPVVMVSTLTQKGAEATLIALELGAVDFVAKPGNDLVGGIEQFNREVCQKVRAAAASKARSRDRHPVAAAPVLKSAAAPDGTVIAIGASTGGVEAVRAVLHPMPVDCPPILVAQHMPKGFTSRFAHRLDEMLALRIVEAEDRMLLQPGHVYIAEGGSHLRVEKSSGQLKCRIGDDSPVSGHRPSVDVLFESVATTVGPKSVGVILTGMGRDGASGLKMMRDAGAHTIGESERSALVYGMPRVAFEIGAVVEQAAIEEITARIVRAIAGQKQAA